MSHDHGGATVLDAAPDTLRFALVGSPNAGKTTLFNALTGLHAKTGNYPGVTVARRDGSTRVGQHQAIIEDLPGAYSLDPISPDERVVTAVLAGAEQGYRQPDGLLLVLDGTTLRRSLAMVSRVLHVDLPTAVVVTFSDELAARDGGLDIAALGDALGVPMIAVTAGATADLERLRALMADLPDWSKPIVMPPTDPMELASWSESVATAATYRSPQPDRRTVAIDRVLLHPVAGTLIFFGVMLAFFECIFTLAAPVQGWIESAFGWLGALVAEHVSNPWLSGLLGQAIIGGVGGVMVFLPQIVLLFFLISLLEACGYMARAAFLMDKVMAKAGLEGRAFVALLSSVACAVPGIMATRTLPSARDRLATMLAAPLMTCSARLPVYVLLIGMLVDRKATLGPLSVQAVVMFSLYLLGAVSAMIAAWVFSRVTGDKHANLPFYMEMPPYRWPRLKTILLAIWDATRTFLTKVGKIILLATVVLWTLLSLPGLAQSDTSARAQAAGVSESPM